MYIYTHKAGKRNRYLSARSKAAHTLETAMKPTNCTKRQWQPQVYGRSMAFVACVHTEVLPSLIVHTGV